MGEIATAVRSVFCGGENFVGARLVSEQNVAKMGSLTTKRADI